MKLVKAMIGSTDLDANALGTASDSAYLNDPG